MLVILQDCSLHCCSISSNLMYIPSPYSLPFPLYYYNKICFWMHGCLLFFLVAGMYSIILIFFKVCSNSGLSCKLLHALFMCLNSSMYMYCHWCTSCLYALVSLGGVTICYLGIFVLNKNTCISVTKSWWWQYPVLTSVPYDARSTQQKKCSWTRVYSIVCGSFNLLF